MKTHLIWFRNDLRVTDNPALVAACEDPDAKVLAVFIATPKQWQKHAMSGRQAQWIYDNLLKLQEQLVQLGIPLIYQSCDDYSKSVDLIVDIWSQHHVDKLFYNCQYEINEQRRDQKVVEKLADSALCFGCHGNLLFPPLTILNGQKEMYKVFTPFRNACVQYLQRYPSVVHAKPRPRNVDVSIQPIPLFDYPVVANSELKAGEDAGLARLTNFCASYVVDYNNNRDIPALDLTSKLSAYLAIGVVSVRQCLQVLLTEHPLFWQYQKSGVFSWFNELIWREFYHHLLVAYPKLSQHQPFIEWTSRVVWNNQRDDLEKWQTAQTGYPIVDAAMRQLNQTGWMHNRLRMITASFLVKDLLIDWRFGERYFMSQLIDGDLAANNGGWQWAASTGTDAAPYFRIFNPTTQGQRFDPNGDFIRHWLPELADIPTKYIHTPHIWTEQNQQTINYPKPIVDHSKARARTLEAFAAAKNSEPI